MKYMCYFNYSQQLLGGGRRRRQCMFQKPGEILDEMLGKHLNRFSNGQNDNVVILVVPLLCVVSGPCSARAAQ